MNVSQSKPVVDAFRKKYSFIEPVLYRSGGGALVNRVLTEARAGQHVWDVVGGRGEMIQAFKEKNLLASYLSPEAQAIDSDLFDSQGYWYSYYVVPVVLDRTGISSSKRRSPEAMQISWSQVEREENLDGHRNFISSFKGSLRLGQREGREVL